MGFSSSLSREAGPPPRTSSPAGAPSLPNSYFRQAQERLYSELAYALGIEEDAVPDYIAQRIALA